MELKEVNANTIAGSNDDNLIKFRFWMLTELGKIQNQFDTVYILGSWYGNISLLMAMDPRIQFNNIINVDIDKNALDVSDKFAATLGDDRIQSMHKDANKLNYQHITTNGLVINASTTNIEGRRWFDRIPKGTMVAFKGRNQDPGAVTKFSNLEEFKNAYPLAESLFSGQMSLQDPETEYDCYLVIGIK